MIIAVCEEIGQSVVLSGSQCYPTKMNTHIAGLPQSHQGCASGKAALEGETTLTSLHTAKVTMKAFDGTLYLWFCGRLVYLNGYSTTPRGFAPRTSVWHPVLGNCPICYFRLVHHHTYLH
jgi:hypothetical protein